MPKYEVIVAYTERRSYRKTYTASTAPQAAAIAENELAAKFARGCGFSIVRGSVDESEEIVAVRRAGS